MFKEFNVNSYVRVKLTEKGMEILKNEHEKMQQAFPKWPEWKEPMKDEEGYTKFQCWDLMSRFGEHIALGRLLPFESDILIDIKEK